ncbi:hypothetical protein Ahy_B01g056010 [Arachis hypogaea]|uniref:Pentatricopeptide repeat-containing protein n=1 Tax=Arachis hypogaea TaxID=3818 RepID=A0A445AXS1_ARAHY|nr:hypothetical protein Ahy_B01g056010 [Arachis hypogaea]
MSKLLETSPNMISEDTSEMLVQRGNETISRIRLLKTVTSILTSHPDPHSALKPLIQNLTLPTLPLRRPRLPQPLLDTSLSAYALSDHPDLAFQLFNKMKLLHIKPNLLTCHSLLSSLVRRHPHSSHSIHLSKQVFNDSLKLGITPNTTTFNILMHGSCLDNNFNDALAS